MNTELHVIRIHLRAMTDIVQAAVNETDRTKLEKLTAEMENELANHIRPALERWK
jgi:hypothetical protein